MKWKELKDKSDGELKKLLTSSREQLREIRFKIANNQIKSVREIRKVKKTISRIMTLLKQREFKKVTKNKK